VAGEVVRTEVSFGLADDEDVAAAHEQAADEGTRHAIGAARTKLPC
jgi:hypothetical protein